MGNTGPGSWGQTAPEKVKTACEKSRIMSFVALEEVMQSVKSILKKSLALETGAGHLKDKGAYRAGEI